MWELHTNNIIHRDLKPQNILVTVDDTLKISDFGFAKSYNPDADLQQTMCGSPLYMAPEILEQKRYTDVVDLWSIGVIMYELYFNEVPVKGKNIKIKFDDWIFMQDERVAINRATMTKFGFKVAELTVMFVKD